MEIIDRELVFCGRHFVFYWITIRQADGETERRIEAVALPPRHPGRQTISPA